MTKSLKVAITYAANDRDMTVSQWLTSLAKHEIKRLQAPAKPIPQPMPLYPVKPNRNTNDETFDII